MTSKHLLRSRRHKSETCPGSMLEKMWLVTESRAVSVEWLERNPCCDEERRWLSDM